MDTEVLGNLISRKRQVLTLLRDMGRAQLELIRTGDMERLLRVLSAKQPLVNQLHQVERDLAPFREEDPETRHWASAAARVRCREDAQVCEGMLAELLELEQKGEAAIVTRRDESARQMHSLNTAATVNRAYTSLPDSPAGQLDLAADL